MVRFFFNHKNQNLNIYLSVHTLFPCLCFLLKEKAQSLMEKVKAGRKELFNLTSELIKTGKNS